MNWPKKMAASGCWNSPMRASALRATLACSIAAASGSPFVMMMIPCCPMHWKPCWSLPNQPGRMWCAVATACCGPMLPGTAVELPHPPGQAIIIHKPAGQDYLQFLQQSGPQFVWNAMYCTNQLGHLRFDETCRKGLEDFAFNAAVFQQADSAAYTPQIVYEHLERQGSTSACGNPAAVQVRLQYLPRWVQAEYTAARAWCPRSSCQRCGAPARQSLSPLSCISCGMAACRPKPKRLPGAACSRRWQPAPTAGLTFGMHCGTIKNRVPHCFCSVSHLQGLYACLPNREEKLLQ